MDMRHLRMEDVAEGLGHVSVIIDDPVLIQPVIKHLAEVIAPHDTAIVGPYRVTITRQVGA